MQFVFHKKVKKKEKKDSQIVLALYKEQLALWRWMKLFY